MEFIKPVEWKENRLFVLNQIKLPEITEYNPKETVEDVFYAIKNMELRGAPLIGIAAGYGMCLGIKDDSNTDHEGFIKLLKESGDLLAKARPNGSNLLGSIRRMIEKAERLGDEPIELKKKLLEEEAIKIHREEDELLYNPGPDTILMAGDRLVSIGKKERLTELGVMCGVGEEQ